MKYVTTGQKGYSLVEILIATAIFSIGLLALASMQISAMQGNTFSGTTTDGIRLAQDHIEQLMPLTYSSLTTDDDLAAGAHPPGTQQIGGTVTIQGITYTNTWNVTDNSPIDNTKTVDMAVTWTENGRQRTVSVQGVKPRIN